MLDPKCIYQAVRSLGVEFFTGVPDSLLKEFCACVTDLSSAENHVIAANEGGSVAMATGHYLASGKCAFVYMQNSGLGNAVNPLLSLADPAVYAIPMLLMIGWRGEPGVDDEPQHRKQGEVTLPMLKAMGIPVVVLRDDDEKAVEDLALAHAMAMERSCPVAVLVQKGLFKKYDLTKKEGEGLKGMTRERALSMILDSLSDDCVVVSTTGKTSREVFELRDMSAPEKHRQDFLTVGSMGHCSQIALGVFLAQPEREVVCLDGDGAMLMQMGGLAIIGQSQAKNLLHIILNNGAHDSVGGQPTVALKLDIPSLGKSLGYSQALTCDDEASLRHALIKIQESSEIKGARMLEVKVAMGSRSDLSRPTLSPIENKQALMAFLE